MKKQSIIRLFATFMVVVMMLTTLASCVGAQGPQGEQGIQGEQGPQGLPGKDGVNGINGAPGKDGVTPTIEISSDGYWVINGTKTEHKAIGTDGTNGTNGVDGVTPTITISEDGYWIINGTKTEYKAIGEDGEDAVGGSCDCEKCIHSYVEYFVLESTCISYKVLFICELCHDLISLDKEPIEDHLYEDGCCKSCGEVLYMREGNYLYFGEYPQTIKTDEVTITSTTDSRGYYLGSDGFYYAKVTATPYDSDYPFSTGDTVKSGKVYYFKVEPIRWRILSTDGETAFILCDSIIANHRYDSGDNDDKEYNNYAESEIREWLNATFYETAFTELQREIILTTTVDNSVESTGYSENQYACEDTEDKIFFLSRAEVTNSDYGFTNEYDEARKMITSDYSRATGVFMNTSSSYYGIGHWWLRSPYSSHAKYVRRASYDGSIDRAHVDSSCSGVVPAMWIDLNP